MEKAQKVEMVTAAWQSCKAKSDSRDSPDSGFVLASERTAHSAVGATIVAPGLSEGHSDSIGLAAMVDWDTLDKEVAQRDERM